MIPEVQIPGMLAEILRHFSPRHRDFELRLDDCFDAVSQYIHDGETCSRERRRLIGAYCTHEYSIEAAALCNPSIVSAPDQSGVPAGSARFIMSLRAIGEGHVSSIEFPFGRRRSERRTSHSTRRARSSSAGSAPSQPVVPEGTLRGEACESSASTMTSPGQFSVALSDQFTMEELRGACARRVPRTLRLPRDARETIDVIHWFATSNYDVESSIRFDDLRARDLPRQPRPRAAAWRTRASSVSSMTTAPCATTQPTRRTMGTTSSPNSSRRPTSGSSRFER